MKPLPSPLIPNTLHEQHLEAMQQSGLRKHDYTIYCVIKQYGPVAWRGIHARARCSATTVRNVIYWLHKTGMIQKKINTRNVRDVRYFVGDVV